ncbi:FAD-binding protein [Verrucomicrobium spinosum]|uniref:FAD-binding protein n=1 Tax=Verrucomicrobium spinosum TaxID=2736 RepID=UPI002109138C|nr:FAD-binding protein [Verrucomicrobium spinosum]
MKSESAAPFSRRHFLHAALGSAAVPALSAADARVPLENGEAPPAGKFSIPAEAVPLADDADVIVCGAGPAGVAAAIAAADLGQRCACLSGVAAWAGCGLRVCWAICSILTNPVWPKS